jgi:hypothetical protein
MAHSSLWSVSVCDNMLSIGSYYHTTASQRGRTRCSITSWLSTSPLHGPRPIIALGPSGSRCSTTWIVALREGTADAMTASRDDLMLGTTHLLFTCLPLYKALEEDSIVVAFDWLTCLLKPQ